MDGESRGDAGGMAVGGGGAEFCQGALLDLADPLLGQPEQAADLLVSGGLGAGGGGAGRIDAVMGENDGAFPIIKAGKELPHFLARQQAVLRHLEARVADLGQ